MSYKFCKKCGGYKKLADFYKRAESKDGLSTYCKDCSKKITSGYRGKSKMPLSTYLAQNILKTIGIPTYVNLEGFKYVDLMAWGVVPIEAKLAYENKKYKNKFHWSLTPNQREHDISKIFILFAFSLDGNIKTFVVPSSETQIFFHENGKPKAAISITLNSDHHNAYLGNLISQFENRFDLIENEKNKYLSESQISNDYQNIFMSWQEKVGDL